MFVLIYKLCSTACRHQFVFCLISNRKYEHLTLPRCVKLLYFPVAHKHAPVISYRLQIGLRFDVMWNIMAPDKALSGAIIFHITSNLPWPIILAVLHCDKLWASLYDVCFLWSYSIVFNMKVIQSLFFLGLLMQAICMYLYKSLQTLVCNTHVFVLPCIFVSNKAVWSWNSIHVTISIDSELWIHSRNLIKLCWVFLLHLCERWSIMVVTAFSFLIEF